MMNTARNASTENAMKTMSHVTNVCLTQQMNIPTSLQDLKKKRERKFDKMIKDSGKRVEFETGAVRDISEGKGRCDLLPLYVVSDLFDNEDVSEMFKGMGVLEDKDFEPEIKYEIAKSILKTYCKWMGLTIPGVILDVSIHFEEGAKKYGEHNWEKGIPEWSYINSATRHLLKLLDGWEDEQHGRAFVWNILAYMYTIRNK